MSSRGARVVVLLVAVAATAAAGYGLVVLQQQCAATIAAADLVIDHADALLQAAHELRAAQQAYVAAGQNEQVWTTKVSSLLPDAEQRLRDMQREADAPGVAAQTEAAATALAAFSKADIRAREYLRDGQSLMASDLIFSEARDALASFVTAVGNIRRREAAASRSAADAITRQEVLAVSGAAGAVLIAVLLLVPLPRAEVAATPAVPLEAPGPDDRPLLGRIVEEPPAPPVAVTPSAQPVELLALALLCTDLGRVVEGTQIRELLGRTASLTGATGLILWVADRTGQVLHAVAAHGYDAKVLARLGPIPRTAENATAAAYRVAQVHTVPGAGARNGALVVPLLGPEGCSGVLTAEVPGGDERRESVRAITMIVAAQLATLVSALPSSEGTTGT